MMDSNIPQTPMNVLKTLLSSSSIQDNFFSLNTNYILFLINNAVFENLGFTVHIAFILRGYLVTSSMIYNLEPIKWSVHKYL